MGRVKRLNGASGISRLGKVVELRELTVGQWLALQKAGGSEQEQSFRMLAEMLYIDDAPIGWERLMGLGMSEVRPALDELNDLLGDADQGNA